jgi:hypothetical protein
MKPHKIGDLEFAHYANIEHDEIAFVGDAIVPRAIRFEQEANRKLISLANRGRRYTKMNVKGLLRGDMKTQSDAFARQMMSGFVTRNQIRDLMELNREDDGFGDKYWKPVNIDWADAPPRVNAPQTGSDPAQTGSMEPDREDAANAIRKLVVSQLSVARRREEKARARQIDKPTFPQWADKFYREHQAHLAESLTDSLVPFVGVMIPVGTDVGKLCRDAAGLYAANVIGASATDWQSASGAAIEVTADKLTEYLFGAELCTAS